METDASYDTNEVLTVIAEYIFSLNRCIIAIINAYMSNGLESSQINAMYLSCDKKHALIVEKLNTLYEVFAPTEEYTFMMYDLERQDSVKFYIGECYCLKVIISPARLIKERALAETMNQELLDTFPSLKESLR